MRPVLCVVLMACGVDQGSVSQIEHSGPVFAISIGDPMVEATPLRPRTITITGYPNQPVVVSLDRATAGVFESSTLKLDANGRGSLTFTPCAGVASNCLGSATLRLSIGHPNAVVASQPVTLVYPAQVGEVAACLTTSDNVLFLHGNDSILNGTLQTGPGARWQSFPWIDELVLMVNDSGDFTTSFSLYRVPHRLVPGIYDHAERTSFASAGHPGIDVSGLGHGCNTPAGRFQVHDYVADPLYGDVYSATISFEQACDPQPDESGLPTTTLLVGCVHYEQTPPTPVVPPTPDPTKVSVQVNGPDGTPDPTAHAIFMDPNGAVVLDTQVNAFGQAEAALQNGGSVTTVQGSFYISLNTYRGLVTGDHVVVNPPSGKTGRMDQMLAAVTPPAGVSLQYLNFITACKGNTIQPQGPILDFYDGCRTPTFSILALATPPDGPAQFLWNTGLPHIAYTDVAMTGSWAPMGTATVTLANVPPGLPAINTDWGVKVDAFTYSTGSISSVGNQTVTLPSAPGAGNATVVRTFYNPNSFANDSRIVVNAASPSAVTFDFATQPVPLPSAIQQTNTGASWTQSAGTADRREIFYRAFLPTTRVIWRIREPNDGLASTTLPTLPAAYAAYDPAANSGTSPFGVMITYVDYDTVSGFILDAPAGDHRSHSVNAWNFTFNIPF